MQFTVPTTVLTALVSSAVAQINGFDVIYKPTKGEVLTAGDSYTMSWEAAPAEHDDKTVAIYLYGGADDDHLKKVDQIAAGVTNSEAQYEWAIPATLGDLATYGFMIELESNSSWFQWSEPFKIDGSSSSSPSVSSSKPIATTGGTTAAHTYTSDSTAPPNFTPTSTSVEEPTGDSEPEDSPDSEEAPDSAAAANSVIGSAAFVFAVFAC